MTRRRFLSVASVVSLTVASLQKGHSKLASQVPKEVDVNILHFMVKLPTEDADKLEKLLRDYVENHHVYEGDWHIDNHFYGSWEVSPTEGQ